MFYNGKHKPHKCIIVRLRPEGSLQRGMWFGLYTKNRSGSPNLFLVGSTYESAAGHLRTD